MMNNRQQRSKPSVSIQNSFGPYDRHELEAARSQLIRDVYNQTPYSGGILARVKLKCGILSDSSGLFSGCEPHPETKVSFQSQSCEVLEQDGIPWRKDSKPPHEKMPNCSRNGHVLEESYHSSVDVQPKDRNIRINDLRNVKSQNTTSDIPRPAEINREETRKRKLDALEEDSDGMVVSGEESDDDNVADFMPSTSTDSIPNVSGHKENKEEKKNDLIISDKDTDKVSNDLSTCFKCDICDHVAVRGYTILRHLKEKNHYSASQYKGISKGTDIIPKYLVNRMAYFYKQALFSHAIPICPECTGAFADIHMCYTHNRYCHQVQEDRYGLGMVRCIKTVSVDLNPKCKQCDKQFDKFSKLNDHIRSLKHNYFPPPKINETVFLMCKHCRRPELVTDLSFIHNHLVMAHSMSMTVLTMNVVYVEKPKQSLLMLPGVKKSETQQTEETLKILTRLRDESSLNKQEIMKQINKLSEKYNSLSKGHRHKKRRKNMLHS